jgi:hypothetical protein
MSEIGALLLYHQSRYMTLKVCAEKAMMTATHCVDMLLLTNVQHSVDALTLFSMPNLNTLINCNRISGHCAASAPPASHFCSVSKYQLWPNCNQCRLHAEYMLMQPKRDIGGGLDTMLVLGVPA